MLGSKILKLFKTYSILTIGVFLYAFSWVAFIIPKGISGGGVTGISTVINFATDGFIPVSLSYLLINVFLLIGGTLILGKGFGFKTIYCILCGSLMFEILPQFECITQLSDIPDKFMNALIGGAISAIGIAAVFMQGGSTGGTDIIAIVVSKFRDTSPGKMFMVCDLIIIGSIGLLPDKGLQDVVYGYLTMVSFTYLLDQLLTGSKQSVQIIIFSSKYKEIGDMLVKDMGRGVTAFNSVGWYSQSEGKVLIVVARKQQLPQIAAAIKEIDNKAFISVSSVMGVYGEGFDTVKAKLKKDKKARSFMDFIRE